MKIRSNWKLGLLVLACVSLAACGGRKEETKSTTETVVTVTTAETTTVAPAKLPDSLLPFKKEKQLVLGELDKLERSTSAHIQLNIKDKPKAKREPKSVWIQLVGIIIRCRLMIQEVGKKLG